MTYEEACSAIEAAGYEQYEVHMPSEAVRQLYVIKVRTAKRGWKYLRPERTSYTPLADLQEFLARLVKADASS